MLLLKIWQVKGLRLKASWYRKYQGWFGSAGGSLMDGGEGWGWRELARLSGT